MIESSSRSPAASSSSSFSSSRRSWYGSIIVFVLRDERLQPLQDRPGHLLDLSFKLLDGDPLLGGRLLPLLVHEPLRLVCRVRHPASQRLVTVLPDNMPYSPRQLPRSNGFEGV
jgi:hypothetical protein